MSLTESRQIIKLFYPAILYILQLYFSKSPLTPVFQRGRREKAEINALDYEKTENHEGLVTGVA